MKRRSWLLLLPLAVALMFLIVSAGASGQETDVLIVREAAQGKIRAAQLTTEVTERGQKRTVTKNLPFLSPGLVQTAVDELREEAADATDEADLIGMAPDTMGCSARNLGRNVRVNQDCTFRRQAEEDIVYNPADPSNLLGGQNDSRIGFNHCGIDWTVDDGVHWGDLLPPFWQRLNNPALPHTVFGGPGTGHTYDAASDPSLAFDAAGNGYFSCVVFDINTNASAILVTQSPAVAKGSFFFNVPATGSTYVVTEDNQQGPGHTETAAHDKEFIAADFYASSPNKNNVYVTWTVFEFANQCGGPHPSGGYCQSPIYGSMSTNGARTWSPPEVISGSGPFCQFGNFFNKRLNQNACNFNQGADPTALPNGDLVVAYNNGNTPGLVNQQLAIVCHPSGSTSNPANITARLHCDTPTRIGDDVIAGEPQCDFGRGPEECIPGAYIRTNDYPRINTNAQNGHVYVVWQDYRNGEYDIQMSESTDGGHTWSKEKTVNPDNGLDHYFAAVDQSPSVGDRVGVSYFRTARVPDENKPGPSFTGSGIFAPCGPGGAVPSGSTSCAGVQAQSSDYVLAGGTATNLPYPYVVVSPIFAAPDGAQIGFNGDYSGLVVSTGTEAHPIWSDTRNSAVAGNGVVHDEDVFSDTVALPSGTVATRTTGTIGH